MTSPLGAPGGHQRGIQDSSLPEMQDAQASRACEARSLPEAKTRAIAAQPIQSQTAQHEPETARGTTSGLSGS